MKIKCCPFCGSSASICDTKTATRLSVVIMKVCFMKYAGYVAIVVWNKRFEDKGVLS